MIIANVPVYLMSWSEEILSRADRIRNLIGSKHWPTDGAYKEILIREFLLRHLPPELHVGKGFIRQLDGDAVSPEIDLVIADPKRHVPIFREGEFQIVPPSSVLATLEIKSNYRKNVLKDAMANVVKVRKSAFANHIAPEFWSGIILVSALSPLASDEMILDAKDILQNPEFWQEALEGRPHNDLASLAPNILCVLDSCVVFIEPRSKASLDLKSFSADRLSGAIAFGQLFGYLRAALTSEHLPGELDALLESSEGLPVNHSQVALPTYDN